MTAVDSVQGAAAQPLFAEALLHRLADAAERLDLAVRREDSLLVQACEAELDDLYLIAARHEVHVRGA